MSKSVPYDQEYFDKYIRYEGTDIADAINAGRIYFCGRQKGKMVLDIGIGSGEFIKRRKRTWGYDINKAGVKWLKQQGLYTKNFNDFDMITMWDVIEHCPSPEWYFNKFKKGMKLLTSIPIFKDLEKIRESRHYRPDEHYYYFTREGFIDYMSLYGFSLIEEADFEIGAGREEIYSFCFKKDLPDFSDLLLKYRDKHTTSFYGSSAHLYFDKVAEQVIDLNPKSILDYGCGRSDIASYFWNDGAREIRRFDPAVPQYKDFPEETFELVFAFDLMEHIRMTDVDDVLARIREKSGRCLFSISLVPARAKLEGDFQPHVTLLEPDEWMRWIEDYFGSVKKISVGYDNILFLRAGL